jgi:spoIIIJ-associated protein
MNEDTKTTIEEFLNKMGIEHSGVLKSESDGRIRYSVETSDSALLIGNKGESLKSLNYLIKSIVSKNQEEGKTNFIVDVGDYYLERVEKVKYAAKVTAERAKFLKDSVEMEPMSSYERLVVHQALADDPEIKTESTGFGKTRRVVIKYTDSQENHQEEEKF